MKPVELFSGMSNPVDRLAARPKQPVNFGQTSVPSVVASPDALATPAAPALPQPTINPGTLALRFGVGLDNTAEGGAKANPGVMSFDELVGSYKLSDTPSLEKDISFHDFVDIITKDPLPLRTSHQRVWDMIRSAEGRDEETGEFKEPELVERFGKPVRRYAFFTNPTNPKDALLGVEEPIDEIVQHVEQAAIGTDARKRMLLLVGGPGSAKSTLARILKTGYEKYCATDEGKFYTTKFVNIPEEIQNEEKNIIGAEFSDQVRVNPVNLLPRETRAELQEKLNDKFFGELGYDLNLTEGELPPATDRIFNALIAHEAAELEAAGEDTSKAHENVLNKYVRVERVRVSKNGRTGIATFEAGDPKSIDQTMMTGNPNMLNALKTSEHNPLAFDFASGEFFAANGGILEFVEALKLPKELLMKLLSLNEERIAKGDKMPDVFLDNFVIAHCNLPEFEDKNNDPEMDATMQRMKIIKMPYNTEVKHEEEIHRRVLQPFADKRGIHVAPNTYRTTAIWAVISRLVESAGINPLDKARLYNGEKPKEMSETEVRRLIDEGVKQSEAIEGISPRELQKVLPAVLTHPALKDEKSVDGYAILQLVQEKLDNGQLKLADSGDEKKASQLITMAYAELDRLVVKDVMTAVAGDKATLQNYLDNYLMNVEAFCTNNEVKNFTMGKTKPDEELMKAVERNLNPPVTPATAKEYRRKLMAQIGSLRINGVETITPADVPDLEDALIRFAVARVKDVVPVEVLLSTKTLTAKEDGIRQQVVDNLITLGYNEVTARNALARFSQLKERGALNF